MELAVTENKVNKKRLSLSLYLNYLIHGFGIIILAQNIVSLSSMWSVPIKTVSFVISGIGIGRLLAYLITGALSDVLNRKLFVFIGMFCYLVFAIGMISTRSIPVAYGLAILAGIANSALDVGTYTTLVEMNDGKGYDTILIKGFMSIGEFILPLIVASLSSNGLWFGWLFIIMAALIVVNMINMVSVKFPNVKSGAKQTKTQGTQKHFHMVRALKTIILLAYGYVSMALMIWFTQWITLFAQKSLNFGNLAAHTLMSLYSTGSIIGVIVLFILLKRNVNELKLLVSLNLLAVLSLLLIVVAGQNLVIANVASLVFGFSAASGVMQTGLTVFMNMFPEHLGMITGIYYFFGSVASFTVPLITGVLSANSISLAFSTDLVIGVIAVVLMAALVALQRVKED